MTDSPKTGSAYAQGRHDTEGHEPRSLLSGGWKTIEPIYVWSALVGTAVAFLLIGIGTLMRTHVLH
jgi:hypothetical protein